MFPDEHGAAAFHCETYSEGVHRPSQREEKHLAWVVSNVRRAFALQDAAVGASTVVPLVFSTGRLGSDVTIVSEHVKLLAMLVLPSDPSTA